MNANLIAVLETAAVGEHKPDLTLVLDLPVDVGLARADDLDRVPAAAPVEENAASP